MLARCIRAHLWGNMPICRSKFLHSVERLCGAGSYIRNWVAAFGIRYLHSEFDLKEQTIFPEFDTKNQKCFMILCEVGKRRGFPFFICGRRGNWCEFSPVRSSVWNSYQSYLCPWDTFWCQQKNIWTIGLAENGFWSNYIQNAKLETEG